MLDNRGLSQHCGLSLSSDKILTTYGLDGNWLKRYYQNFNGRVATQRVVMPKNCKTVTVVLSG